MWLLVGLGNPGPKYERNRHNIGFMAVDAIAHRHSFGTFGKKFSAQIAEGTIGGEKTYILKPQTFMNLSGDAVGECTRFYKIAPERVIVLHDELDLKLGKLRVKKGGGNGGHNGLKSIDAHIGADYWRVRLGIDHPGHPDAVTNYVLGDFAKSELDTVDKILHATARHIDVLCAGDDAEFMNKVALEVNPPPPKQTQQTQGT